MEDNQIYSEERLQALKDLANTQHKEVALLVTEIQNNANKAKELGESFYKATKGYVETLKQIECEVVKCKF